MAIVSVHIDSKGSDLGFLSPLDIELSSGIIDAFYLVSLNENERYSNYIERYSANIVEIRFENPLDIKAIFNNVTFGAARRILDRVLFYSQEKERREIANARSRADLIGIKLSNIEKLSDVRNRLIKGGMSSDEATRILSGVLSEQGAELRLSSPADQKGG